MWLLRILGPWPGIEPESWQWKPRILTTRPPGNSLSTIFGKAVSILWSPWGPGGRDLLPGSGWVLSWRQLGERTLVLKRLLLLGHLACSVLGGFHTRTCSCDEKLFGWKTFRQPPGLAVSSPASEVCVHPQAHVWAQCGLPRTFRVL